jgi:hypothetical protein
MCSKFLASAKIAKKSLRLAKKAKASPARTLHDNAGG